jgi:hypothetical protein
MDEKFWIENPYIIINKYYEIIPSKSMSRIQQMNTITRFLIYFIILCVLFDTETTVIFLALMGIIVIIFFYNIYMTDNIGIQNDIINEASNLGDEFIDNFNNCSDSNQELNKPMINIYDSVKNKIFKGNNKLDKEFEIESGYIDSDGNYKLGPNYSDIDYNDYTNNNKNNNKKKKVSWEKSNLYRKNNYRKPTVENPFANIAFSDYLDSSNLAEPCNIDDEDVQNNMQNLYNSSIYRNLEDVWERENSQRMFYTVPIQTVPNSQTDFANWLYKTGPTCHENTQYCTYYEDPTMTSSRY